MTVLLLAHPMLAPYIIWAVLIISTASSIDCALPQPGPGSHWTIPRRLLSYAALNFGNAANLRSPAVRGWLLRLVAIALRVAPAGLGVSVAGLVAEKLLRLPAPVGRQGSPSETHDHPA